MGILEATKRYKATYKNYISVIWGLYRNKDTIDVILKDGTRDSLLPEITYALPKLIANGTNIDRTSLNELKMLGESYRKVRNGVSDEIVYKSRIIVMHGSKSNGDVWSVFLADEYKFLNVKDKVVIDVGANIGDSAIYFALKGAKKVVALEPYPYSFNFAIRNIKENDLEEKIELLNAGYGLDGKVLVDENLEVDTGKYLVGSRMGGGREVKIYSLKSLIENFDLDEPILKMDCEGCEYNLLSEDDKVIAEFPQMQIEYHYGHQKLVEKLRKAGFTVRYTKPKRSVSNGTNKKMLVGYIYAQKV